MSRRTVEYLDSSDDEKEKSSARKTPKCNKCGKYHGPDTSCTGVIHVTNDGMQYCRYCGAYHTNEADCVVRRKANEKKLNEEKLKSRGKESNVQKKLGLETSAVGHTNDAHADKKSSSDKKTKHVQFKDREKLFELHARRRAEQDIHDAQKAALERAETKKNLALERGRMRATAAGASCVLSGKEDAEAVKVKENATKTKQQCTGAGASKVFNEDVSNEHESESPEITSTRSTVGEANNRTAYVRKYMNRLLNETGGESWIMTSGPGTELDDRKRKAFDTFLEAMMESPSRKDAKTEAEAEKKVRAEVLQKKQAMVNPYRKHSVVTPSPQKENEKTLGFMESAARRELMKTNPYDLLAESLSKEEEAFLLKAERMGEDKKPKAETKNHKEGRPKTEQSSSPAQMNNGDNARLVGCSRDLSFAEAVLLCSKKEEVLNSYNPGLTLAEMGGWNGPVTITSTCELARVQELNMTRRTPIIYTCNYINGNSILPGVNRLRKRYRDTTPGNEIGETLLKSDASAMEILLGAKFCPVQSLHLPMEDSDILGGEHDTEVIRGVGHTGAPENVRVVHPDKLEELCSLLKQKNANALIDEGRIASARLGQAMAKVHDVLVNEGFKRKDNIPGLILDLHCVACSMKAIPFEGGVRSDGMFRQTWANLMKSYLFDDAISFRKFLHQLLYFVLREDETLPIFEQGS